MLVRPTTAPRALAILSLLMLTGCLGDLFGGNRGMGEECDESTECSDDGTCLAGVCEGYSCTVDDDCDNEHVCADIAGVSACALPCEGSGDCAGEQQCVEQEGGSYCL